MKRCRSCRRLSEDDFLFCPYCGRTFTPITHPRGGSVRREKNGTYTATAIVGWKEGPKRKNPVRRVKRGFKTESEAWEYIPILKDPNSHRKGITFAQVFQEFMQQYEGGRSAVGLYNAAFGNLARLHHRPFAEIMLQDIQAEFDTSTRGWHMQQSMKTILSQMYKYAIPRGFTRDGINLSQFVKIKAKKSPPRKGFTVEELEQLKASGAKYTVVLCYTGFRVNELLALKVSDYDTDEKTLTGGSKTKAGKNRVVTISPKIQPIIDGLAKGKEPDDYLFDLNGKKFSYAAFSDRILKEIRKSGIANPVINGRTTFTAHSCRHTFATLVKRVAGNSKDKLELMGHTSEEMLQYYQDVSVEDLRKITDAI